MPENASKPNDESSTSIPKILSDNTKTPILTRKSKLAQLGIDEAKKQAGAGNDEAGGGTPRHENNEEEKNSSSDSESEPENPAILRLANTELEIELAKNKNMKDEMELLKARLHYKELMGGENWSDVMSKSNPKPTENLQTLVNSPKINETQSVPSMQSFRPIQTSSRENSSFRSSVETKQTFSQHVWFAGSIHSKELREELSEYAVDTLDGIVDWFKEGANIVEKLMATGGQVWKTWVSKLIQLKVKVQKLLARYENKSDILEELRSLFEVMDFWYSHVNSEAELKGTFQFIASWADEAKTRQVMGSNMANDFKRALSVSRNDQREKFVHQKSTLQLRTMNSSADWRAQKSGGSSSSYQPKKEYYKNSRDSSNSYNNNYKRDNRYRDNGRDRSRDSGRRNYQDRRDQKRSYDRNGGNKKDGENTLAVKQF